MSSPLPPHICIKASAGSGKTYALTNRYIKLLTAGVDPAKIIALTFTRKASSEFLDTILKNWVTPQMMILQRRLSVKRSSSIASYARKNIS